MRTQTPVFLPCAALASRTWRASGLPGALGSGVRGLPERQALDLGKSFSLPRLDTWVFFSSLPCFVSSEVFT